MQVAIDLQHSFAQFSESSFNPCDQKDTPPAVFNLHFGPEHVFHSVHPHTIFLFGKDVRGLTLVEAFGGREKVVPSIDFFDRVYLQGESFDLLETIVPQICAVQGERTAYFNIYLRPFKNEIGQTIGVSVSGTDVTENVKLRRALELERAKLSAQKHVLERRLNSVTNDLRRASKEMQLAQRASETKSEYVAYLAHEFRTPLSSIIGFGALLKEDASLSDQEKRAYLERISANAVHLNELVDSNLDLAAIESGKLSLEPSRIVLNEIIEETLFDLESLFIQKEIKVHFSEDTDYRISSDAKRIKQILTNLLSNAVKYSEAKKEIWIRILRDKNEIKVLVRDQGFGIDIEAQSKLFEAYSRLHVGSGIKGTGLGLFHSRKIARALNGELSLVESSLGHGSEFLLSLPSNESIKA